MTAHQEILGDEVLVIGQAHELRITAHGIPVPQGSMTRNQFGAMYADNAKSLKPWRAIVASAAREAIIVEHGPAADLPIHPRGHGVSIEAVFTFARPKNHYGSGRNSTVLKDSAPRRHTGKPDTDKLIRAVLDSLKDAGLVQDDCQAVVARGEKTWAAPHGTHADALQIPGAVIRVRALP